MKKVAIVGGGPSRKKAPLRDKSWEIWSLGRGRLRFPRLDRWFEMHSVPQMRAYRGNPRKKRLFRPYWRYMRRLKCPVYMQKRHASIPNSVPYPLKAGLDAFGRCFTCSVSYMIGLAILEKYDVIGLWGIDLAHREEYAYQRPAVQYLLAVARQRGIDVRLPRRCPITVPERAVPVRTAALYGYEWDSPHAWWNKRKKARRRRRLHRRRLQRRAKRILRGRSKRRRLRRKRAHRR